MSPSGKHVVQLDLNGKYITDHPSVAAAARAIGCHKSQIVSCCNKRKNARSVKGFIFVFWNDYNPFHDYAFAFNNNCKPVAKCDLEGNILETYPSIQTAGEPFGKVTARYKIGKCCNGKAKTYAGFKWKFV